MRHRLLVGAAVALAVLAVPGVAHAAEDPEEELLACLADYVKEHPDTAVEEAEAYYAEHEGEELTAEAEELAAEWGGDCKLKENNPILPEPAELIWGSISFAVLFFFLAWKGYPVIKKAMNDRTARIQADVDAADKARADADAIIAEYEGKIAEARTEAAGIVDAARKDAEEYKSSEKEKVDADLTAAREQGQADVEAAKAQAMEDLKGEVAGIAVGAAEQVVGQNLDRAANERLVEEFIDQVGSSS